ncbi:hypothetical protein ID866_4801 [Astraeus odoratus]|nr:hypothetical protein ID866_4801 [Astraeus odoratus]
MPTTVNTGVFLPSSRITPAFNIDTYASAIRRYSRRLLTYESDIVAAITAFINVLTIRCEPPGTDARAAFPYGMWVKYLDYTLLWQPRLDTSQSRRLVCESEHSRWPSWAWAGWKGGVDYTDETTLVGSTWSYSTHGSPVESLVATWHVVKEDRELVRLDVERFLPSWNAEDMGRERYSRCRSHQSDLEMAFLPPPGTLVFRTQRTHFQVVKMDGRPQDKTFTIFDVFAPQSESKGHVGRIILPVETSSLAVLEFIVISRSGGSRGLHDELSWGDVYYGCMLHVMAVRQSFSDIRLRERLGVGLVIESAWLKSAAEEAVILLA